MDRLAIIDTESRRLADVLSATDPDSVCPTCPGWTASELLWHLTNVHFFWAGIVQRRVLDAADLQAIEDSKPARPAATTDMLDLRQQATSALLQALSQRDDDEPCWSWWPADQTVGFTRRMQTYEATLHRVDAELTAGVPVGTIADDVAAGAVDHAVDVMWGWMDADASYRTHGVVEFAATDTAQNWLVDIGSWTTPQQATGIPRAQRATAGEPTGRATGPVVDLALWAWTRGGEVQVSGDPGTLAALDALLTQGMQ